MQSVVIKQRYSVDVEIPKDIVLILLKQVELLNKITVNLGNRFGLT